MKFNEILNRITGISLPIFGISWNSPQLDITSAQRVILYLEDRRVLYVPHELEVPQYCVDSILQIRQYLTQEIGDLDPASNLSKNLRAMRAACRKFLDTVQADEHGRKIIEFAFHPRHYSSWVFNTALGELRGVFGVHLVQIAAQYGLDIDGELEAILPAEDKPN